MLNNYNSFATDTNVMWGTSEMPDLFLQAFSLNIPGISISPLKIGGRSGAQTAVPGDRVEFAELNLEVLLDNEWKVYDMIYDKFLKDINVENGTFTNSPFDIWVEIYKGEGTPVKRFWFYNCRLISISDILFDVADETDATIPFSLAFDYDYMDFDRGLEKSTRSMKTS